MPDMSDSMAAYENPIPAAVRRQSAQADEIIRALNEGQTTQADGAAAQPDGVTTIVVEPAPAPTPTPAPAPTPTPAPVDDGWEQRYRTLQGKYDAEVPGMRERLAHMEGLIAAMQHAPPAREPAPPAPPAPAPETTFAPVAADVETYGDDLIQAVRRWVGPLVQAELSKLDGRLLALEGVAQRLQAATAQGRVEVALERQMPEWQQINTDPQFLAWLRQVEPSSGRVRHDMLTEAHAAGDAPRVVHFFRSFQQEHTVTGQAPGTQPTHTAPAAAPTLPLESLAAPGRGSPAAPAPGAPGAARIWTNREIRAFYHERRQGKFNGREAEADRIEADILAAGREGRVRQ